MLMCCVVTNASKLAAAIPLFTINIAFQREFMYTIKNAALSNYIYYNHWRIVVSPWQGQCHFSYPSENRIGSKNFENGITSTASDSLKIWKMRITYNGQL